MSMNKVLLNGRLPHFEASYKQGEGDNGRSFLGWALSVKRDYKPADAQYYPEDLLNFKAFGPKADFIKKNFSQGDGMILEGRVQKDDDYEKDGQTVKGQMFILVENAYFAEGRKANGEGEAKSSAPAAKAPTSKPGVPGGKPGVPGAKPGIPGGVPKVPAKKPF